MFNEVSFNRLRVFCTVVECKGFRAASDHLNVSQPSISAHIKALEDECKIILIERSRLIRVTEAGMLLYNFAKKILNEVEQITCDISELRNANKGRIAVAGCVTMIRNVMPAIFGRFKQDNPGVELILKFGKPREVFQMIINREIDFGFVVGEVPTGELSAKKLMKDEVVLVANPRHPLVLKGMVKSSELSDYPFVLSSATHTLVFQKMLLSHGINVRQTLMVVEDADSIKNVVANSQGLAVKLKSGVIEELRLGKLAKINLASGPIFDDISLVQHSERCLSPIQKKFLKFALQEIESEWSRWHTLSVTI